MYNWTEPSFVFEDNLRNIADNIDNYNVHHIQKVDKMLQEQCISKKNMPTFLHALYSEIGEAGIQNEEELNLICNISRQIIKTNPYLLKYKDSDGFDAFEIFLLYFFGFPIHENVYRLCFEMLEASKQINGWMTNNTPFEIEIDDISIDSPYYYDKDDIHPYMNNIYSKDIVYNLLSLILNSNYMNSPVFNNIKQKIQTN